MMCTQQPHMLGLLSQSLFKHWVLCGHKIPLFVSGCMFCILFRNCSLC